MLAESVLTGLAYRYEHYKPHQSQVLKVVGGESWQDQLTDTDKCQDFHTESKKHAAEKRTWDMGPDQEIYQQNSVPKAPMKKCNENSLTQPLPIVRREQYCEELDLYRSWSSQSLYQNYPDLHIGGDHIADHTCDLDCIMDQTYDDLPAGPVFLSRDIRLGHSPTTEPLQNSKDPKIWHDEAGERSIMFHKQPISNSLINSYMETKVQELYKQFLEEKLTQCGSITQLLTSNLLMNNTAESSHTLPQECCTDRLKATQTLLQSLAFFGLQNTSSGNSSEFSTPNLQISAPLGKQKPSGVQHAS
ncbi:TLR adapter interacting with SLC15A4 on the lysosome-like [Varanus komodoensis]|uniref:Uncharacterized protein n=1 Tax=Varanus komodoensis TaxID=61221 RepID=A0A8D2Q699_VARKO|nr:TLR adapter interacting with SLC15A4 on the lysosome-like [Varanus komodoensis]